MSETLTWQEVMSRPHLRESDLRLLAVQLEASGDRRAARYCVRRADHIAKSMPKEQAR